MNRTQNIIALNTSARTHEKLGNTLLASWMLASAKHFESLEVRTQSALDNMRLGCYEEPKYNEFKHEWFSYEDEYADNFSMD